MSYAVDLMFSRWATVEPSTSSCDSIPKWSWSTSVTAAFWTTWFDRCFDFLKRQRTTRDTCRWPMLPLTFLFNRSYDLQSTSDFHSSKKGSAFPFPFPLADGWQKVAKVAHCLRFVCCRSIRDDCTLEQNEQLAFSICCVALHCIALMPKTWPSCCSNFLQVWWSSADYLGGINEGIDRVSLFLSVFWLKHRRLILSTWPSDFSNTVSCI